MDAPLDYAPATAAPAAAGAMPGAMHARAKLHARDPVAFLEWCDANEIYIDDRLQLVTCSETSNEWGFAVRDSCGHVELDALVSACPKSAILSVRTSNLYRAAQHDCDIFSSASRKGFSLALCLLYEFMQGSARSRFWGYLQSLPDQASLPSLWAQDDPRMRVLAGTEVARLIERRAGTEDEVSVAALNSFFAREGLALLQKALKVDLAGPTPTSDVPLRELHVASARPTVASLRRAFQQCFELVSSRAFVVDVYHGLALVPVADVFDHAEEHGVHLESDDEVCLHCGMLLAVGCPHYTSNAASVAAPPATDTVVMRAVIPLAPGAPVFNTYGPLSNAELILRYGFSLDLATEHDRFSWDPARITEAEELVSAFGLPDRARLRQTLEDAMAAPAVSAEQDCETLLHEDLSRMAIDAEGRCSLALWRVALLASAPSDGDENSPLLEFNSAAILLAQGGCQPDDADRTHHLRLVGRACDNLCALFRARIGRLWISDADNEQRAFDVMDTSKDFSMVSALRVAQQEAFALRTACRLFSEASAAFAKGMGMPV